VRGKGHGWQGALVVRGMGDGDGRREEKGNFAKFSPPGVIEGIIHGEVVMSGW